MESINTELANELWAEHYVKHGKGWLTVRTGSMIPLFRPGDRVLIYPALADEISRGDIIVFRRDRGLIAHRVLKKQLSGDGIHFTEKGDSSAACGKFNQGDIIGRVSAVKGGSRLFVLDLPFSKFFNHGLSLWCYWTIAAATKLLSSNRRNIRRLGGALVRLSLLSSNILIRTCSVFWYLSGLYIKNSKVVNHGEREGL